MYFSAVSKTSRPVFSFAGTPEPDRENIEQPCV
jgi:hypothetical protein